MAGLFSCYYDLFYQYSWFIKTTVFFGKLVSATIRYPLWLIGALAFCVIVGWWLVNAVGWNVQDVFSYFPMEWMNWLLDCERRIVINKGFIL